MKLFTVRLLINAVAIMTIVFVLPGVHVEPTVLGPLGGTILSYLIMGLLFGLINSFIRPLVLLVTARLLIVTMGAFALIINTLMLLILSWVAPAVWTFDGLLWLLLAGGLMALILSLLEAVFGVDRPIVEEAEESAFYWRWLRLLPEGRRKRIVENLRLQQAYDTVYRYGLDVAMARSPVSTFRHRMQRRLYPDQNVIVGESVPVTMRMMLEDLGPTYIKIGQMAASRADALPPDWVHELEKLQSTATPFSYRQVDKIIQDELGASPEECFATFDQTPLAAASTAQIHRATLHSGEDVVVKVQRPDIDVTVRGDLDVMGEIVHTLENRAAWARDVGVGPIFKEFALNVVQELDYRNEAFNGRLLAYNLDGVAGIHIPTVYPQYSTAKVLTMEFVSGVKITKVDTLDTTIDRDALARRFLAVMLKQVLIDGFFHADPHPGNVLVDPETHDLIFLDAGMMGALEEEQRLTLGILIWTLKEGDATALANIFLELTTPSRPFSRVKFERDMDRLVKRYLVLNDGGTPDLGGVLQELFSLLFKHGLRLETEFTLALKALMQAEESVRALAPELSMYDVVVEETQHLAIGLLDADFIVDKAREQVLRTAKEVALRLPNLQFAATKWLDQFEAGEFTVQLKATDLIGELEKTQESLQAGTRWLATALLLVGLVVGTAIAATALVATSFPQATTYAVFVPFVIAVLVSLIFVLSFLWDAWQQRRMRIRARQWGRYMNMDDAAAGRWRE